MLLMLNDNIKNLRVKSGLSQVDFARRIGVTKQCVSNWENDNVQPSVEMLVKISEFFNVSTDYLLGREPLRTVSVDGLNEKEIAHINFIISDLKAYKRTEP